MSTASDSSEASLGCKRNGFFRKQLIIDTTIWCFVCVPVLVFFIWGRPYTQGFYCDDVSIQKPYKRDTISNPSLLAGGLGVPLFLIFLSEILNYQRDRDSPLKSSRQELLMALKGLGVFLFGTMVCKVFTEITKYSVGRLRPNFIDVCSPDFSNINCSTGYITEYECQSTVHSAREIRDSRLSFPSGHASFGVFCSVFAVVKLTCYRGNIALRHIQTALLSFFSNGHPVDMVFTIGELYVQERLKIKSTYFLKPAIQSATLLLSLWCCLTRITDHKHFPSDVIAGALLGTFFAVLTFYKVGLPVFREPVVTKPDIERAYSVNSESEPKTPDPLLKHHPSAWISREG